MTNDGDKSILRKFWLEVFNKRNFDLIDTLFADDWTYHGIQELQNKEELKGFLSTFFHAFPDLEVNIDDIISEGDQVVTRVRGIGTHKGEFMGFAPT